MKIENIRTRLTAIADQLNDTFVQRDDAVRVILLGTLAQQNYLLVGDPGTAKTSVIDCFTRHVKTDKRFKILLGRFTQPEHVFGPLDISAFKAGQYRTVTDGMMTDAPLPILDEALKASDGLKNSLLGVLGPEREYQQVRTGIICTGAATNWPEVESLSDDVQALYDRFLLRCHVTPVDRDDKAARVALFRASGKVAQYTPSEDAQITVDELRAAGDAVKEVTISDAVIELLDAAVGRLMAPQKTGTAHTVPSTIKVSDRRVTQLQRVLQANAWLEGRDEVTLEDFDVLKHGLWSARKDMEQVDAVIDTIDSHMVQQIIKEIDDARDAYRALKSNGYTVARMTEVHEQIKCVAVSVVKRLELPVFTKSGKADVKRATARLRRDFEELQARAMEMAGKK